jgi:DNA repair photolyase
MYPWAYTANPLGGQCEHKCYYCYVDELKTNPMLNKKYRGGYTLNEKDIRTPTKYIEEDKVVFVCNCTDLFAEGVPDDFIVKILNHCNIYDYNTYLFQSKNPIRFVDYIEYVPKKSIFGTTIETDMKIDTKAPDVEHRARHLGWLANNYTYQTMVSVEPIHRFDVVALFNLIQECNPSFVSIGADSKGKGIHEPKATELEVLIETLENADIEVRLKKNLNRLLTPTEDINDIKIKRGEQHDKDNNTR